MTVWQSFLRHRLPITHFLVQDKPYCLNTGCLSDQMTTHQLLCNLYRLVSIFQPQLPVCHFLSPHLSHTCLRRLDFWQVFQMFGHFHSSEHQRDCQLHLSHAFSNHQVTAHQQSVLSDRHQVSQKSQSCSRLSQAYLLASRVV